MTTPQPGRPEMPESFGVDNPDVPFEPIEWSAVVERLAEARNYWIATVRPSGRPHSVPVWGVWTDDSFYFLTDMKSLTATNLAQNPSAEVHLESGDEVVMLFGAFERIDLDAPVLAVFAEKYKMPPMAEGFPVFRLKPNKAIAWGEANFPSNATRWRWPTT